VIMEFISPDGDDGYPGELAVETSFKLFGDNTLQLEFHAHLTKHDSAPTIVNLCNHAYWNLSGDISATNTVMDHQLHINAPSITELDSKPTLLPTGRILPVSDTPYDFTTPRVIGERIAELDKVLPAPGGYDINFVLSKDFITTEEKYRQPRTLPPQHGHKHHPDGLQLRASFAARLEHPTTGRIMDVYTTAPGLQCYTGNFLDGASIIGREKVAYPKCAAICLETQAFPDAINNAEAFKAHSPDGILRAGEKYVHITQHRFHTVNN